MGNIWWQSEYSQMSIDPNGKSGNCLKFVKRSGLPFNRVQYFFAPADVKNEQYYSLKGFLKSETEKEADTQLSFIVMTNKTQYGFDISRANVSSAQWTEFDIRFSIHDMEDAVEITYSGNGGKTYDLWGSEKAADEEVIGYYFFVASTEAETMYMDDVSIVEISAPKADNADPEEDNKESSDKDTSQEQEKNEGLPATGAEPFMLIFILPVIASAIIVGKREVQ